MKIRALLVSGVFACGQASATVVMSDAIFNSGWESGISLQGSVGYPGPLANATVELHLGSYVATTATKTDGTYKLLVEQQFLAPVTIAELIAFGHGADVAKVWASPLGPSDRLAALGSDGVVTFAEEPFLNLNPRSTALAAALRAYNGFVPIGDKATFYKAARSYQDYVQDLTYALAMVARGDQVLPAGVANLFEAVATLAPSQRLYADEQILANVDCSTTPTAPICVVRAALPTDPAIIPTYPWNDGRTYFFGLEGFNSSLDQPNVGRPHVGTADFLRPDGTFVTTDSTLQADGSYLLTLAGGAAIVAGDDYQNIPPYGQVHVHDEVIAIHVRSPRGPGGQTESQGAGDHRVTYPDNPGIQPQPVFYSDTYGLPRYTGNDALPPELVADAPTIANHGFVLASPFAVPVASGFDTPYGYDVYMFGTSSGSTKRQAKAYTFSVTGPASFSIDFSADATTLDVQFINEESPGIWVASMHASGPSSERFFVGLLMETSGAGGLGPYMPGTYQADVNEYACGGPYATLDALTGNPNGCTPPFGWIFTAASTVNRLRNGSPWGEWQLPGGADTGRLLFATPGFSATPILQIRGWELVRSNGSSDGWVLENVTVNPDGSTNAPPVSFKPTARLVHITQ